MRVTITTDDPELRAIAEKMVADAGGPEEFLKQEAEHKELSSRMARESASLRELYPDKFAAMARGNILVIGDTLEEIIRGLDEKGVPRGKAIIQFLDVEWGPLVV